MTDGKPRSIDALCRCMTADSVSENLGTIRIATVQEVMRLQQQGVTSPQDVLNEIAKPVVPARKPQQSANPRQFVRRYLQTDVRHGASTLRGAKCPRGRAGGSGGEDCRRACAWDAYFGFLRYRRLRIADKCCRALATLCSLQAESAGRRR